MATQAPPSNTHVEFSERDAFGERLFDTVEALVVVLDTDCQIVRFNRKCQEVTGYSATEVKGKNLIDLLISPEEREAVREVFSSLSEGKPPASTFENYWLTRSGDRRYIRWSNTVLRDEEGRIEFVVGTGLDLTKQRQLERKVVTRAEEERRRIGEELHDMLAPQLCGTAMMVEALANQLEGEDSETANEVRAAAEQVREAAEQARSLSHSLLPAATLEGDLASGLQDLAERQEQMRAFTCSFEEEGTVPSLSEETTSHLYHLASEAVANAAQHADPSTIELRLGARDDHLVLAVRDDGAGIPEEIAQSKKGAGLYLMETRAELIGADLHVGPAEDGGTHVRCRLPLEGQRDGAE